MAKLPTVPKARYKDVSQQRHADAVQNLTDVLTGRKGSGLERAVLVRDLIEGGLVIPAKRSNGQVDIGSPSFQQPEDSVLSTPPAPTNVQVSGTFSAILIEWDKPNYQPASAASYTEVWRNSVDELSSAVLIATTPATLYSDSVGTGASFYYWVRHVNVGRYGDTKVGAYSSANGIFGQTTDSVQDIIDNIELELRTSALVAELQSDISSGDSVVSQALAEAEARLDLADATADAKLTQTKLALEQADSETNASVSDLNLLVANNNNAMTLRVNQVESAYKAADGLLDSSITALERTVADENQALAERINLTEASVDGVDLKVQDHSKAIADINNDGSLAYQAMWSKKVSAGDVTAGIGLVAGSGGVSQVAVSASQFFVFNPASPTTLTPTFAIDSGKVVIPKAMIEKATISILNAQTITADFVKAGITIASPTIRSARINTATLNAVSIRGSSSAGFGTGGPYSGYNTFIYSSGLIRTNNIQAYGGHFSNVVIDDTCTVENVVIQGQTYSLAKYSSESASLSLTNGTTTMLSKSLDLGLVGRDVTYRVSLEISGAPIPCSASGSGAVQIFVNGLLQRSFALEFFDIKGGRYCCGQNDGDCVSWCTPDPGYYLTQAFIKTVVLPTTALSDGVNLVEVKMVLSNISSATDNTGREMFLELVEVV